MIICFKSYSGDYESAIRQAIIGLDLIEARAADSPRVQLELPSVEEELIHTFARLDIQAMSFIDPRPPTRHAILKDSGQDQIDSMPEQFSCWKEARVFLNLVGRRMLHFMSSILPESHSTGCLTFDVLLSIPDEYHEEREKHLQELLRWHSAFSSLKDAHGTETDEDFLAAAGLELQYLTCFFTVAILRTSSQAYPDTLSYMPIFEKWSSYQKPCSHTLVCLLRKLRMLLKCRLYVHYTV